MNVNRTLKVAAIALIAALVAPAVAPAQVTHTVNLTGPAFMIDGTASVGQADLDVDVTVEELIDKLEIGGIAGYRLETPKWTFMAEGAFMGLGQSAHGLSMDLDMAVLEADAGYRFNEIGEVFAGVRYTELAVEIAGQRPLSGADFRVKNDATFLDPIVGARFATPLGAAGKWRLQGRGDIGGFGLDMDFQWQAILDLGYRPNDRWSFWLGYRALAQDFDGEGKEGRFGMDVVYQGPQLGVAYTF